MRKPSHRVTLAASAAALALLAGQAAHAQTAAPANSEVQELDVVVVTAQKRSENVQDVPISISVLSGESLQQRGASQLTDYAAYVPGLQVDSGGSPGKAIISLRGIAPLGQSTTVGIYVDDAPIGSSGIYNRSQSFSLDLLPYDIQRVELLRGPQGTLYGASSIGGLLKYVTVQPSLSEFSGRAGGEVFSIKHASDAGYAGSAMVNIPLITDKLGMTVSYSHRDNPGFIDNVQTGEKDINSSKQDGARAALLWEPTDKLSVKLSGIWQKVDSDGNGVIAESSTGVPVGNGWSTNHIRAEPFSDKFQYYAGTVDYDLGPASLTSTTTYSKIDIVETADVSRLYGTFWGGQADFPSNLNQKKFTQETRLTSPSSDHFEWMVGTFYTHEKNAHNQIVHAYDTSGALITTGPFADPFAIVGLPNAYTEYAVFGNATYKFSERFFLTGGLRWAHNDQNFRQISVIPLLGANADQPGSSSESVVTYSISPQFHVNDDTMLYARIASGYRPGGPNVAIAGVPPTVSSDTMTNYEAGVKSSLLDRTLTVDLAAFYMDWQDIQLSVNFPSGLSGFANAGSAVSQGFEGTIAWEPMHGLSFGLNGAYTDSKLSSDTPPSVGGMDGDRLPRIPKWSGSITADYAFNLNDKVEARIGGALRHTGKRYSEVTSSPTSIAAGAYTALDLNAGVTFDRKWTLRAYARNVTDTDGVVTRDVSRTNVGFIDTVPLQPRTLGLAIDVSF